jgi:hypothetical protein
LGLDETVPLMASSGEPAEGDDDANDQLLYAIDSFTAVLKPVSISMVLASIVVTAFQNDSSSSGGGLSACVLLDRTLSSTCSVKFLAYIASVPSDSVRVNMYPFSLAQPGTLYTQRPIPMPPRCASKNRSPTR